MLFHLDSLEEETRNLSPVTGNPSEWKALLDKLRVNGLMDYWLSDEYHDVATAELAKVNWSKQPKSAKAQYEKPIWFLRAKRRFMQVGSYCKQKLLHLKNK